MGIEILFIAIGAAMLVGIPASLVVAKRRAALRNWSGDFLRDGRRICPSCEEILPPKAVACRYCGTALRAGATEPLAEAANAEAANDARAPMTSDLPHPQASDGAVPDRAGDGSPDRPQQPPRQRAAAGRGTEGAGVPPQTDLPWTDQDFARIRDHGPQGHGNGGGPARSRRAPRRDSLEDRLDQVSSRMSAPLWSVAAAALLILIGLGVLGVRMLGADESERALATAGAPAGPPSAALGRIDPSAGRLADDAMPQPRSATSAPVAIPAPMPQPDPLPPIHPLEAALSDATPTPSIPEPVFPAVPRQPGASLPNTDGAEGQQKAYTPPSSNVPAPLSGRDLRSDQPAAVRAAPSAPAAHVGPVESGGTPQAAPQPRPREEARRTPPPRPLTPRPAPADPAASAKAPSPPAASAPKQAALPSPSQQQQQQPSGAVGEDVTAVGELVVWLQGRLSSLGYYSGPINGRAGPETSRAIMAYQRGKQLTPTGRINEALIVSLRRAGSEPINESRR